MTNIVLFRLAGDDTLWLADLEAGTVEPTEAFDSVEDASDESAASGVDFAIAATSRSEAASHLFYPNHGARLDGVESAHAATARSEAASHLFYPNHGARLDGVESAHAATVRSEAASHLFYPSH
jgi:hypothetical protein